MMQRLQKALLLWPLLCLVAGCASQRIERADLQGVEWAANACNKFYDPDHERRYLAHKNWVMPMLIGVKVLPGQRHGYLPAAEEVLDDKRVTRSNKAMLFAVLLNSHDRSVRYTAWHGCYWLLGFDNPVVPPIDTVVDGPEKIRADLADRVIEWIHTHAVELDAAQEDTEPTEGEWPPDGDEAVIITPKAGPDPGDQGETDKQDNRAP